MRRDVFQAIADPVRRDIIDLLSKEALTVNEVAEKFEISRPAISKHLKILNECGLVTISQKGRERYCQIEAENLIPAFLWIEKYHKQWEDRIDSFENYINEIQSKNRQMDDLKKRTLTLEKTLNAPVKVVWNAWTESNQIVKWWAPKGTKLKVIEHNFKVGGKWKYSMPMPDGKEFVSEGVYKEIVDHQKIVSSADFKPMTEGVELHILFEADGEQTKFTFSVIHPTEEYCKQQEEMGFYNGWGSAFDRLDALVSTLT